MYSDGYLEIFITEEFNTPEIEQQILDLIQKISNVAIATYALRDPKYKDK